MSGVAVLLAGVLGLAPVVAADEGPSVIVEPRSVAVAEGRSGGFHVRLSEAPASRVPVMLLMRGTGIWAMPPMIVMFGPADWNQPKPISLYSAEDADSVDDVMVVTLTVPGYAPAVVTLTQVDNDH